MRYLASILVLAISFLSFTVFAAPIANAQNADDPLSEACQQTPGATSGVSGSSVCDAGDENPLVGPDGVITRATSLVSMLVGVAAVFMIMIGGYKYITSAGDSGSVTSAKNTILYAVVGLMIALIAQSLVIFVLNKL